MKGLVFQNLFTAILLLSLVACSNSRTNPKKEAIEDETSMQSANENKEETTVNEENSKYDPATVNDELAKKVGAFLVDYLTKSNDLAGLDEKDRTFQLYEMDLNNDGANEVFVNFSNMYFCGSGGCTVLLLNSDLTLNTRFTVMNTPIYAEKAEGQNWATLTTYNVGKMRELKYKNGKYPSNPSTAPAAANQEVSETAIPMMNEENKDDKKFYSF